MTRFPAVELTVYAFDCDAFGHVNQAAWLRILERARWDALALGPGIDVFRRNGVWPALRRATVDYREAGYPGDVVRIETSVTDRGTTSVTLRHTATRVSDSVVLCEADMVFVMIDRVGRPVPLSEELGRLFGPRTAGAVARAALRVPVDGAELSVDVRGEGMPVLFIHGFPFDRTMWRHQLAGLTRWRRIAPDLRGAGESSAPDDGYSMARYADDLVAVLEALDVGQTVVCGLSMGGYVAFELLRRHAQRVRALILADTRAEADSADGKRAREEMITLAERDGAPGVVERMLPRLFSPATRAAQPEVVEQVRAMMLRAPVAGIVGALRAMRDRPDSTPVLAQIRVPALVLVGADDAITPPDSARALAGAIAGAHLVEIEAAGHLAPLEQPLVASRAIAEFLSALG